MHDPRLRRDVEEQLGEALAGMNGGAREAMVVEWIAALRTIRDPAIQKLLIWLWALRRDAAASFQDGFSEPQLEIQYPEEGGDLAIGLDGFVLHCDIDPLRSISGRYCLTRVQIDADPRGCAVRIFKQLADLKRRARPPSKMWPSAKPRDGVGCPRTGEDSPTDD